MKCEFITTGGLSKSIVVPNPTDFVGYNYQYVESPPTWLVCNICQYPCRDPHLSVCCGKAFCKFCLDDARKVASTAACLVCQDKKFITFPNNKAARD